MKTIKKKNFLNGNNFKRESCFIEFFVNNLHSKNFPLQYKQCLYPCYYILNIFYCTLSFLHHNYPILIIILCNQTIGKWFFYNGFLYFLGKAHVCAKSQARFLLAMLLVYERNIFVLLKGYTGKKFIKSNIVWK